MAYNNIRDCIETYYDVMEGIIKNATRIRKEMGMLFYIDKSGSCTIGNVCTGASCSVHIPSIKGLKPIGMFHVHAQHDSVSVLSMKDLYIMITEKHSFSCVGSEKEGIRCYVPIDSRESKKLVSEIKKEMRVLDRVLRPNLNNAAKLLRDMNVFIPSYYTSNNNIKELTYRILSKEYMSYTSTINAYIDITKYIVGIFENDKIEDRYIDRAIYENNRLSDIHKKYVNESIELRRFLDDNRYKIVEELTLH